MNANKPHRFHHPGAGRRRAVPHPRGRQVDPDALAQVRALIGDPEPRRDMLIEYLHAIQDTEHGLAADHLTALADLMKLSLVEVYEADEPDQLRLKLRTGTVVVFGRADQVDEKARALGAVLEDLGDTAVAEIDVRAPSRPVVVPQGG